VSSRRKGNRNELRAVKELEADGWLVYRVKGSFKFTRNVDLFGLFDIAAKQGPFTRWIQVKTNRMPNLQPFREFKRKYCSSTESVEVWCYRDYKECRKVTV